MNRFAMNSNQFRAGFIALAGRPNVGKSTLLNQLIQHKISITSRRANTTRHRIIGVLNESQRQLIFVDMPGYNARGKRLVERSIHKTAVASMQGVDVALLLLECRGWHANDAAVWNQIQTSKVPLVIVLNKIDRLSNRDLVLPVIQDIAERTGQTAIVPISAKKGDNVEHLKDVITEMLPPSPPLFEQDYLTDRSDYFQLGELVREQIFRSYGAELPYACAVEIEKFAVSEDLAELHALIWVETEGQKRIIIGSKGEKLKQVGSNVRQQMEGKFGHKAYVRLWVKVQPRWSDNERYIEQFGYSGEM